MAAGTLELDLGCFVAHDDTRETRHRLHGVGHRERFRKRVGLDEEGLAAPVFVLDEDFEVSHDSSFARIRLPDRTHCTEKQINCKPNRRK
jgi:hypothetical protein